MKNDKLPTNIITPTTKAADGDVPISQQEILNLNLMTISQLETVFAAALELFAYGQVSFYY